MPFKKLAQKYKTPKQVQLYLKSLEYNREKMGVTLRSASAAIRAKTAHCFEAAFIAAAILEQHGYPPQVMSFESHDGLDHVIFVFRENSKWGAVAKSRDEGLHGRPPIYKTLRDLALSYYEPYIDMTGRITAFQLAHLDHSKSNWRSSKRNVWKAEKYLLEIKHQRLKSSQQEYKRILEAYKRRGPMPRKKYWW